MKKCVRRNYIRDRRLRGLLQSVERSIKQATTQPQLNPSIPTTLASVPYEPSQTDASCDDSWGGDEIIKEAEDELYELDMIAQHEEVNFLGDDDDGDESDDDSGPYECCNANDEANDEEIFEGSGISVKEAMISMLHFVVTSGLNNANIQLFLSHIHFLFGNVSNKFPKTLYRFKKYFHDLDSMRKVYYCVEHKTVSYNSCKYCGRKQEYICWNGITQGLLKRLKEKKFYENVC